jgi:hypothetical protein
MLTEQIARWGEASFRPPASAEAIQRCEASLGGPLPDELRRILLETNGIESDGLDLLFTAERIGDENAAYRGDSDFAELYMPFDGLVLFSEAGDGDQFAMSLSGNQEVFRWDHEDDSRIWVAPTIMRFLQDRMTGRLAD